MYKVHTVRYKGQRFRSKTEAQYAYVFEKLGIEYEYEPEVVALNKGEKTVKYLPDFFLHKTGIWVEIKNRGKEAPTTEECWKAWKLAIQSGKPCFIFFGDPLGAKNYPNGCAYRYDPDGSVSSAWQFAECVRCRMVAPTLHGKIGTLPCNCPKPSHDFRNNQSQRIQSAILESKNYSFDVDGW